MIKILVATDLSERSAHALQRAVQLVRRQGGGDWALVHVVDADAPNTYVARQVEQARSLLETQAEQLAEQAGSRPAVVVGSGDAAQLIGETALSQGAQLLVVGAHRKSALRDFFLGTTLERLVRSSRTPVLRVNGPVTREYGQALLALDLTDTSLEALRQARRLQLLDAQNFAAVHALETPASGVVLEANIGQRLLESQQESAEELALRQLNEDGVSLPGERLWVRRGHPEQVIADALKASGADLLVMGTQAREGFSRFVLGSVASRLLATLDCDALTVPPAV